MKRAFHRIGHGGLPSRKRGNMHKGMRIIEFSMFRRNKNECYVALSSDGEQ